MTARGEAERGAAVTSGRLMLCADDYAMTDGVSRGIEELIAAGRLSATSAMTSMRHWPTHAARIARCRDRAAIGLHFNLTLGRPLTAMPRTAPGGVLPPIGVLTRSALAGGIDRTEVAGEMRAQIAAFAEHFGALPDFIDGHQHVHALPGIRHAVLDVLGETFPAAKPLVRDPADGLARMLRRGRAIPKAVVLSSLAYGFGALLRRHGFAVNDSFAGVSDFVAQATAADFAAARVAPGRFHLVMCHPGYVDDELATLDPLTTRRRAELDLLLGEAGWQEAIWHPRRGADGHIDWIGAGASAA